MKNQIYVGNEPAISLPVANGTKAGDPVKVGIIVGVAATDRADSTVNPPTAASVAANSSGNPDGYASVEVSGTYLLTVAEAISSVGTQVYITGSAGSFTLTTTASTNVLFGETVPGPNNKYVTTSAGGTAAVRLAQA